MNQTATTGRGAGGPPATRLGVRRHLPGAWLVVVVGLVFAAGSPTWGDNITQGTATAQKFGAHEIVLTGDGSVPNPFTTAATVTFTPPSGSGNAKTVVAFYDGGNTWRARVYVTELGTWQWRSSSPTDPGVNDKSGSFMAVNSNLPGIIQPHPSNPKALITQDGQWFPIISDTGYRLFHPAESKWQEFVRDDAKLGVNTIIAGANGIDSLLTNDHNPTKYDPWEGVGSVDYSRYDLAQFQTTDSRLIWIFNNYPNMFIELILFTEGACGGDGGEWMKLPASVRQNTMRYMIARWAAFPNVTWLES